MEKSCLCVRKKIVELVGRGVSVSEVARVTGLSRKSVYKWIARSDEAGEAGLGDRSRAPHHFDRFDGEQAEWLLDLRRRFPRWGARKLLAYAERHRAEDEWPSRSTVAALLQRRGMIAKKRPRSRFREPFRYAGPTPTEPNERWTMDFKGDFRVGNGAVAWPFTLRDAASRKVLDICVMPTIRGELVKQRLEKAFRSFGLPNEIQSDNGPPFASRGLAHLSTLSVWLLKHDVLPVLSRPGKPQDNGAHERMHRDYKAEVARPPAPNLHAQQVRSSRWMHVFNEERPHEALDGAVPDDRWCPSPRPYDPRLERPVYPAWWETRCVDCNGDFSWRSRTISCGKAFRRQSIGLEPIDEGLWRLHYANYPVGLLDERIEDTPRILNLAKR